ncbi:MAG: uroporphyrinogen-III C-methyltransferase, partial [Pseudomonadota bacterium]
PDPASAAEHRAQLEADPQLESWEDALHGVGEVLRSLVVVREHDKPIQPLLGPEQRFYLGQNLKLQLEQARVALLRGEPRIYAERIAQAQAWIEEYFDTDHAATQQALATLKDLAGKDVRPALPDATSALRALASYQAGREARARARRPAATRSTPKATAVPKPARKPASKPDPKPEPKPAPAPDPNAGSAVGAPSNTEAKDAAGEANNEASEPPPAAASGSHGDADAPQAPSGEQP